MATRNEILSGSFVGRYQVGALLGRGGAGAVYAAWDTELEREVALKTLAPGLADDPRFQARFRRESRLAAALEHPAVIPVYDAGESDGVFYIAMRLVHGSDLRAILVDSAPLDRMEAARLLAPVAAALDAAHQLELVHRDVKPANILVADDGVVQLADFGLARTSAATRELSSTANLVGTVDYVAPEQIRDEGVGPASDQYSLACVLFECLTGRRPFERASELATLWAHVDEVPPLPSSLQPNLPHSVDDALAVALAKEPSARFGSCTELIDRVGHDAASADPVARTPFLGLAAFDTADAPYFFGRERVVTEVVERLRNDPIVVLVGPSGSGKSSLLRAGVVPALARSSLGGRAVLPLVFRPGDHPADTLANELVGLGAADDVTIALAVDQFEEVFTLCRDEEERRRFLDELGKLVGDPGFRVLLAVRDDSFGACAAYPEFASLLDGRAVLVRALAPDELERAIVGPAARAGVGVDPDLVHSLREELDDEPNALPLLAAALLELWQVHEGDRLTTRAGTAAGGIRGAIARLAEQTWSTLDDSEQAAGRRLLLRLATTGPGGEPLRRRVRRAELETDDDGAADHALTELLGGRLLVERDGVVEVTHEALFRQWPRLRALLEEDAEGRHVRVRLAEDASVWAESGRDTGDLYRGARLASVLEWATTHEGELNRVEREFLEEGLRMLQRSQRRLRAAVLVLAALLVLALVASGIAVSQRGTARREARVALARELGADAVSEPRIDRAMLLAREASNLDPSAATAGTLLSTLVRSPQAIGTFALPVDTKPYKLTLSPDGRTLIVADQQGALRFYDTRTRAALRPPLRSVFGYAPPAFSPDGSLLLTVAQGAPPSALQVRDAHTLRVLRTLPLDTGWLHANPGPITPLGISADRRHAFFTYEQGTASGAPGPAFLDVWNLETGRRTTVRLGSPGLHAASFVDNGRIVTVTSGAVETWDPTRLRLLSATRLRAPIGGQFAAIAPDGRTVAGFIDGSGVGAPGLIFVDAKTGHSVPAQGGPGPGASFHFVRFSPDDRTVATTLTDGRVVLWDARTGEPTATLVGHGGDSTGADFARDGRTLYSSSLDGAVIEWALDGTRRFGRPFTAAKQPYSLPNVPQTPPLAVSPDGTLLAMRVGEDRVGLYALPTTNRSALLPAGHGVVTALAWSPNGVLAAATTRGGVRMWRGKQPAGEISGLGPVQAMTFSPNGELLAADLKQLVVQHAPGNRPRPAVRLPTAATALAVAPDGRRAAVGLGDVGVAIVDVAALRIIRTLHPIGTNTSVAFTSDASLLTGSFQGLVQRWRLNGDEFGQPIRAASGPVAAITVAPGGATFATSSLTEGVVRLWRTATLEQFGAQLPGPPYVLTNVTFTPDGSGLVVLYHTGQGMLWPMSDATWRRHACSVAGRNMSRLEWAQFVGSRAYARTC